MVRRLHAWEGGNNYHDDNKHRGPVSLILKWLYTALNTKIETNSETKKGRGFGFVKDRLTKLVRTALRIENET